MSAYWWGVATLPLLVLALLLAAVAIGCTAGVLRALGFTFEVKKRRRIESIDDYVLRRNIWFERQRGPAFAGHWCREDVRDGLVATRWIGLGSPHGPCVIFYKKRTLK